MKRPPPNQASRAAGDRWALAHTLTARGQLLLRTGDLAAGRQALAEAEAVARELGSPFTLATALNVHAGVLLAGSDDDAALDRLEQALRLSLDLGSWNLIVTIPALALFYNLQFGQPLLVLALVAARRGILPLAATLFAAAERAAAASALVVAFPPYLASAEDCLRDLRSALDEETFDRAWSEGRELPARDLADCVSLIRNQPAPI